MNTSPLNTLRKLLFSAVFCTLLVGCPELVLRAAGLPEGTFSAVEVGAAGLWPSNFNEVVTIGPVPYRVAANADGFRGPPLRPPGDADARVVCIGDSMTDGFYVDNPHTYPAQLQATLDQRGHNIEIVNAARGGGSIDRFTDILEQVALPLQPDAVVVTWVNNDLWEQGRFHLRGSGASAPDDLVSLLLRGSALGEALLRISLGRHAHYQPSTASLDARYQIPGGQDHEANADLFLKRFKGSRVMLTDDPSDEVLGLLDQYTAALDRFLTLAGEQDLPVLYVVMPGFAELVRDLPRPHLEAIAPVLSAHETRLLDLRDPLRAGLAEHGTLTLAPLDFHLNPTGNRIVAEAVAAELGRSF